MSKKFSIYLVIFVLISSKTAYAYLDPGIFTFFWQAIVIAIASVAVSIKIFWYKIVDTFNNLKKRLNGKNKE